MPVNRPSGRIEAATQLYTKIAEIRDNTVVLKDGSLRAVLEVSSVNFDLKSEQEQNVIIYTYQEFLNFLEFPVQILIRSKKLDIDGYLENVAETAKNQTDPLLKEQTYNYLEYVASLVKYSDIMEKRFYVVVPQDVLGAKSRLGGTGGFMKQLNPADSLIDARIRAKSFANQAKALNTRVNGVMDALTRVGVHVERLGTEQLIELFYEYFNPSVSETQRLHHQNESNWPKLDVAAEETLREEAIKPDAVKEKEGAK